MRWIEFRRLMCMDRQPVHHEKFEDFVIRKLKEIQDQMPSVQDVKDAVAKASQDVITAVNSAVTKETAEVVAQIQAIQPGTTITQADLDAIVASVQGIGTAASTAIDTISANDGAVPAPPPPPTV